VATLLGRVRQQAERFHRREKELDQARQDLIAAMRAAYEEGVPIARIAREAGVSRPTAYDWLKRR
jgi:AcrR family transcriptional regulator